MKYRFSRKLFTPALVLILAGSSQAVESQKACIVAPDLPTAGTNASSLMDALNLEDAGQASGVAAGMASATAALLALQAKLLSGNNAKISGRDPCEVALNMLVNAFDAKLFTEQLDTLAKQLKSAGKSDEDVAKTLGDYIEDKFAKNEITFETFHRAKLGEAADQSPELREALDTLKKRVDSGEISEQQAAQTMQDLARCNRV